jgi:general secretion pathway protein E
MNQPVEGFVSRLLPIPAEDLQWAMLEAGRGERKLADLLEERLGCAPEEFVMRLANSVRLPAVTLEEMRAAKPAFDVIPYSEASRRGCVALRSSLDESDGGGDAGSVEGLLLVLGDPYDADVQAWLEERIDAPFSYVIAHPQDIVVFLSQHEQQLRALEGAAAGVGDAHGARDHAEDISFENISETNSPVVRVVNSTLYDALKAGASDIHLESTSAGLCIKYRIDGVLTPVETIAGVEFAEHAISRIKVMSDLDIAERRVPQDGRFKARRDGREIDFRVSIMPSSFGEDAVLRILDKKALTDELRGLSLAQLGYEGELIKRIRRVAQEPYGMLLVTGPTGSGKTTTLYAAISEANTGRDKIITIEDPVEYQLPGVLQIPVNEQKGLTFARGLRSILRHDPDRIMVGEIRDPETAEIAVQSALTGHLVYTTVHANNVFDVLGRFMHMGVDTYNFVSALNAVLAQRLVRQVCRHCAAPHVPDAAVIAESRIDEKELGAYRFMRGRGCAQCRGTGFKGRKAIGELLVMNDALRELIVAREPIRKLKEAARAAGTIPLREAALELVKSGQSTLEEINRVTFVA